MPTHENFTTLMNVAKKDLKASKFLSTDDDVYVEGVCFHSQQCAEKALKAFLDLNGVRYPFIHDLERLCLDCKNIDNTFSEIFNHCLILNNYSAQSRYIDDSEVPIEEMYEAIKLAEEVYNFVKAKIKED